MVVGRHTQNVRVLWCDEQDQSTRSSRALRYLQVVLAEVGRDRLLADLDAVLGIK